MAESFAPMSSSSAAGWADPAAWMEALRPADEPDYRGRDYGYDLTEPEPAYWQREPGGAASAPTYRSRAYAPGDAVEPTYRSRDYAAGEPLGSSYAPAAESRYDAAAARSAERATEDSWQAAAPRTELAPRATEPESVLDGRWRGSSGEQIDIRGRYARVSGGEQGYCDCVLLVHGDRLIAYNPEVDVVRKYELAVTADQFALRDDRGQVMVFERVR